MFLHLLSTILYRTSEPEQTLTYREKTLLSFPSSLLSCSQVHYRNQKTSFLYSDSQSSATTDYNCCCCFSHMKSILTDDSHSLLAYDRTKEKTAETEQNKNKNIAVVVVVVVVVFCFVYT